MTTVLHDQIASIDRESITVKTQEEDIKIWFSECIKNFGLEYSVDNHRTVGTRDVLAFTFVFFSTHKVEVIIKQKGFWWEKFHPGARYKEFHHLQMKINELGYGTYDLT